MAENVLGDFFLSDADDEPIAHAEPVPPAVQPVSPPVAPVQSSAPAVAPAPAAPVPDAVAPVTAAPAPPPAAAPPASVAEPPVAPAPAASREPGAPTREQRLAETLDRLMEENPEIEAAALVSLDGFTMASALPEGMHEDRVGAMSAAILGLGERAAAELGRGDLTQIFIEGEGGYVMLIAAGKRSVLTCLADPEAKLGLVLYDMREAAGTIARILG